MEILKQMRLGYVNAIVEKQLEFERHPCVKDQPNHVGACIEREQETPIELMGLHGPQNIEHGGIFNPDAKIQMFGITPDMAEGESKYAIDGKRNSKTFLKTWASGHLLITPLIALTTMVIIAQRIVGGLLVLNKLKIKARTSILRGMVKRIAFKNGLEFWAFLTKIFTNVSTSESGVLKEPLPNH